MTLSRLWLCANRRPLQTDDCCAKRAPHHHDRRRCRRAPSSLRSEMTSPFYREMAEADRERATSSSPSLRRSIYQQVRQTRNTLLWTTSLGRALAAAHNNLPSTAPQANVSKY